jgi:uncharacterized membrane protein HdeD (DUF308 family)
MLEEFARNWWLIVFRGVFSLITGLIVPLVSHEAQTFISVFIGLYILADGVLAMLVAVIYKSQHKDRLWLFIEGIVGIIAGALILAFPAADAIIAIIALWIIAIWSLLTGICEITFSILRWDTLPDKWALLMGGMFSILLGILLFSNISSSAAFIVAMVANYMIIFGVLLIVLGLSLRNVKNSIC